MSTDNKPQLTYPHLYFREPNPLADGNYPGFAPGSRVADGMRIDRDVEIPVRDGSVLYADVHRPADPGTAPLPVLISWGPYGKHGGRSTAPSRSAASGVDPSWVSPYAAIEAPDPLFWCRHGYAVVYVDPRGTWSTPATTPSPRSRRRRTSTTRSSGPAPVTGPTARSACPACRT